MIHPQQRAEERYYINNLNTSIILNEILNNRCELIKSDQEHYSHIFLIRYFNKYLRVVTDYEVRFVKTVLPLKDDFDLINKLNQKLILP